MHVHTHTHTCARMKNAQIRLKTCMRMQVHLSPPTLSVVKRLHKHNYWQLAEGKIKGLDATTQTFLGLISKHDVIKEQGRRVLLGQLASKLATWRWTITPIHENSSPRPPSESAVKEEAGIGRGMGKKTWRGSTSRSLGAHGGTCLLCVLCVCHHRACVATWCTHRTEQT